MGCQDAQRTASADKFKSATGKGPGVIGTGAILTFNQAQGVFDTPVPLLVLPGDDTPEGRPADHILHETFISNELLLQPGQVVFSDVTRSKAMMPEGKHCIVGFAGEVVNASGHTVPYDEVYNHHCDLYSGDHPNDAWDVSRAFDCLLCGIIDDAAAMPGHAERH